MFHFTLPSAVANRTEASIYDKYCNVTFIHYIIGYNIIQWLLTIGKTIGKTISMPMGIESSTYLFMGCSASFVFVDALSYFVHMFIDSDFYDRYLTKNNKVTIVDVHHKFPLNYSYLSDTELVSICYPFLIPFLFVTFMMEWYNLNCVNTYFYMGFKMVFLFYSYFGAWSHRLVHERMCKMNLPFYVKWAQDMRLILHPNQHRKHHHTFDCQYSLLNGSFQLVEECLRYKKTN